MQSKLNYWLVPLSAALSLLAISCAKEIETPLPSDFDRQENVPQQEAEPVNIAGMVEVQFDGEILSLIEKELSEDGSLRTKSSAVGSVIEDLGITHLERIFPEDPEFEDRHREAGLHKWYRVVFDPSKTQTKAEESLGSLPGVGVVNPVYKVKNTAVFNDPYLSRQWHYDNPGTKWADVNIVPVWQNYTTGDPKVIVSVVDGGIDPAHEDLKDNFIPAGTNGSKNFMSGGMATRIVAHSHGTHVGGTISAVNNNGKGVCGIAGGDAAKGQGGVKLMSCQVFQENAGGGNFEAAMIWGADHGAVISNNSWGYDFTDSKGNYNKSAAQSAHNVAVQPNTGQYASAFKNAVDYFNKYAGMTGSRQTGPMAGGIMFFAAGNDGQPYGAPGCYPGCMSVGATTSYGTRSNFSNYGDWVDICAPGVGILSTLPGNSYGDMSGTSMACPHVTGVAALVLSYCGGEGFTREQLWDKMVEGANSGDIPASYRIGPLADALGAITYGSGEPPSPVSSYSVEEVVSNNVVVKLTVPADKDGKPAYGFRVLAATSSAALQACDPARPGSGILYGNFLTRDAEVGSEITGTVGDLGFNTQYYIAVSAYDYGRNYSAITDIKRITTGANHAPTITCDYKGDWKFHVHERIPITFHIVDEDRHVVNVEFTKDERDEKNSMALLESVKEGEYQVQVTGSVSPAGVYNAVISASDNYGLSAEYPITYEILPNAAPVVLKQPENIIFTYAGENLKLDMSKYIQDPDGELLVYSSSVSDDSVVNINQLTNTETLSITALTDSGLATVTLSSKDAGGVSVETSFSVLVRSGKSGGVMAYPNPVVNTLKVGTGDNLEEARIVIASSSGSVMYDKKVSCSVFEPAEINMKNAAPGVYTLKVTYGGNTYSSNIVKK